MKFSRVVSEGFSTAEAARLASLSPRQLDHWDRQGFLRPSLRPASGYGSARRYSFADVVRLKVAARLRAQGLALSRVKRCAEALKRLDPADGDLARARLIVKGDRVFWAKSDQEVVDLFEGGQLILVFSIAEAVAEAEGAVAKLAESAAQEGSADADRRRRSRA